ncbi:MAG: endonuclease/exonuclease/phosphatase family protein [Pyrinomonadaceae bacterium]
MQRDEDAGKVLYVLGDVTGNAGPYATGVVELDEHGVEALPHPALGESSTTPDKVVIATYNIRYGVGSFLITGSLFRRAGLTRPGRRAALIERHLKRAARAFSEGKLMPPADIIALQEADRFTKRAGGRHVAPELAMKLDMEWVHTSMNLPRDEEPKKKQWYLDFEEHIGREEEGDTGVALLSRWPVVAHKRVELPWAECAWRPRLAVYTAVQCGAVRLHVFNSHIDPHADVAGQLAQHEAILAEAEQIAHDAPVVLTGDFNTLTPVSRRRMRGLLEYHGYATPMPSGTTTWRAGLVRLHTDWIFTRGVSVTRWGVARPLGVSDHWPVWAELDLSGM